MTYLDKIHKLSDTYINKIISFLKINEFEIVEFKKPFAVVIEKDLDDENEYISCITQFVDADGYAGGVDENRENVDWELSKMSLEELALILDMLYDNQFNQYSESEDDEFLIHNLNK